MSMIVTEDCINFEACAVECPTEAIFEPGENSTTNGKFVFFSNEHFF
jgi:NAD-dependent dihydropyrimidine dehydrogenase PreA subunit